MVRKYSPKIDRIKNKQELVVAKYIDVEVQPPITLIFKKYELNTYIRYKKLNKEIKSDKIVAKRNVL